MNSAKLRLLHSSQHVKVSQENLAQPHRPPSISRREKSPKSTETNLESFATEDENRVRLLKRYPRASL